MLSCVPRPTRRLKLDPQETHYASQLVAHEVVQRARKRKRHVLFALDDFGTGLSSFGYLKHFPVDFLKIDGSFVRDIALDKSDHAMVSAINQVGHALGMKTIAEFVENDATIRILRSIGVDYVQGYGVGRPTPILDAIAPPGPQLVASR